MEHELSAFYNITHGHGLAILTPRWLTYVLSEETAPRIKRFGENVFGIDKTLPLMDGAKGTVAFAKADGTALTGAGTAREIATIQERYKAMYRAMIAKDMAAMVELHVPKFVLIHMSRIATRCFTSLTQQAAHKLAELPRGLFEKQNSVSCRQAATNAQLLHRRPRRHQR